MNNKHIGIITFCNTLDNYGQVLQYVATQEYLEARGHSVYLYQSKGHKVSLFNRVKRKIKKVIKKLIFSPKESITLQHDSAISEQEQAKQVMFQKWAEITRRNENEHPRYFEDFRSKYFHRLNCYYEELKDFYAFAVGSDQMWSFLSEDTMLEFVPNSIRRFSLAPSVGHKVFTTEEIARAAKSLKKFDFITVREQNGIDFCEKSGRTDAQKVLDPTFLISSSRYEKYADLQGIIPPKHYILLYLLGSEIGINVQDIFIWAKEKNLEIVYVASQGREDDFPKCYASVEQWLALLKNADYVVTNSFHGMALSIIYHKQFLVFPLVGLMKGMNGRIEQMAKNFALQDYIYSGNMDNILMPIDWSKSDEAIIENEKKIDILLKTINL